jgi:hypothetical protein
MGTMAGMRSNSSDRHEGQAEPVYLLTRRRSSFPPPPSSSPNVPPPRVHGDSAAAEAGTWRLQVRPRPADLEVEDNNFDDEQDVSDIRVIKRFTRRRRGIRVLGALAIAGVLAGGTFVFQQPKVQREALSFVTMGHEEGAVRLGRRIASKIQELRR